MTLTEITMAEDQEKYIRQIELPEIGTLGQERIFNSKVLVVGAGGLGCPALQYLTSMGVGTIGIADFDRVSLSNLHRQILYSADDLDESKVDMAKKALYKLNPKCVINTHDVLLSKKNAATIISGYDLVIDATDMIPARYLINDTCVALNKPFIYGAIYKYQGQVAVFNYQNGPTYRCLFPDEPKEKIQNCDQRGVLAVLPGIIGLMQASEAIKLITGFGEPLSGFVGLFDLANMQWDRIKISKKSTKKPDAPAITDSQKSTKI